MNDITSEQQDRIQFITFNRETVNNAFNDDLLFLLQTLLDEAEQDPDVRVIVLKAQGRHFSAGADINWMRRMADYSEAENEADAQVLARVMHSLYASSKPTVAMVQGAAFGGGAGLVAACDIAIASHSARFCFSEVKLGLIPAVISPYVIRAIGARQAAGLFMSAEQFEAQRAFELGLVQYVVSDDELLSFTKEYAQRIANFAPQAAKDCKSLVHSIEGQPINEALMNKTASLIAKKRVSLEGQKGLQAFLNKETPYWE